VAGRCNGYFWEQTLVLRIVDLILNSTSADSQCPRHPLIKAIPQNSPVQLSDVRGVKLEELGALDPHD